MRSALRKMGNSIGLIVPKAVLQAAGVASGAVLDLIVEDGRIIAIPVRTAPREGWKHAAIALAESPDGDDELAWRGFGVEEDDFATW